MKAKRILAIILACLLALSLLSCNESDTPAGSSEAVPSDTTPPETDPPKVIETRTYKITEILDSIKTHGRTSAQSAGLTCDFSSCGIEFNAYVEGKLTVDVAVAKGNEDSMKDDCYFTLYVDGVRSEQRLLAKTGATTTLELADFETGGVHNIRLIRQTEARNALATLSTLSFTGYLEKKPANAQYYVEFMGASNTAGYGNLIANGAAGPALSASQDSTQSYTYLPRKSWAWITPCSPSAVSAW